MKKNSNNLERVTIQEARKLFERGVTVYLLPSHTEYVKGIGISVFTNNLKDKDFDFFVKTYKALSSNKMRYYVEEKDVAIMKQKNKQENVDKLKYSKKELMNIGSNVAMLWGASCYDYEVNYNSKEVTFFCIEHGENFATSIKFSELENYL